MQGKTNNDKAITSGVHPRTPFSTTMLSGHQEKPEAVCEMLKPSRGVSRGMWDPLGPSPSLTPCRVAHQTSRTRRSNQTSNPGLAAILRAPKAINTLIMVMFLSLESKAFLWQVHTSSNRHRDTAGIAIEPKGPMAHPVPPLQPGPQSLLFSDALKSVGIKHMALKDSLNCSDNYRH